MACRFRRPVLDRLVKAESKSVHATLAVGLVDARLAAAVPSRAEKRNTSDSEPAAQVYKERKAAPYGLGSVKGLHSALSSFWQAEDERSDAEKTVLDLYAGTVQREGAMATRVTTEADSYRGTSNEAKSRALALLCSAGIDLSVLGEGTTSELIASPDAASALATAARRCVAEHEALERAATELEAQRRSADLPKLLASGAAAAIALWLIGHFVGAPAAILLLPAVAAVAVYMLRPPAAVVATERLVNGLDENPGRKGHWAMAALLWLPRRVGPSSANISDPFVRAAARVAGFGYLFAISAVVLLAVAAAVLYIALIIAAVVCGLFVVAKALESND